MRSRTRGSPAGGPRRRAVGGSALAYFSSEGSGSASAAVTKLTAPTISAATPAAGGTVTLTWGAVTAPGAGSVTYYVTRDDGNPAGTCPTAAAPTTAVTCKDSGVALGEHTYRVTALWKSWSAVGGTKTANVTVGQTTKFTISGSTATPAAGGSVNLTITAKDVNNSTVTTYTGSHSLVFSGASSSPAEQRTHRRQQLRLARSPSAARPRSPSAPASPPSARPKTASSKSTKRAPQTWWRARAR